MLTRDATRELLNEAERRTPEVVRELIPDRMSIGQLQKVLQNLVSEHVSVRPMGLILECLSDHIEQTQHPWKLTELVRQRLSRQILTHLQDQAGTIAAFSLSGELQEEIESASVPDEDQVKVSLAPSMIEKIAHAIRDAALQQVANGRPPVMFVQQSVRPTISRLASANEIDVTVLGDQELGQFEIQLIGEIGAGQIEQPASQVA